MISEQIPSLNSFYDQPQQVDDVSGHFHNREDRRANKQTHDAACLGWNKNIVIIVMQFEMNTYT